MKQEKIEKSTGMNIFTVVVCVGLVAMLIGAYIYLLTADDFVPPTEADAAESGDSSDGDAEEENSAVWDATIDDLIAYLDEMGYIDADDGNLMSTVGTENYIYNEIDIMWWDVDNLVEGTEEYEYWTQLNENGYILLYGQYIYTPVQNGPFAIYANTTFPGDTNALYEDFAAFTGAE